MAASSNTCSALQDRAHKTPELLPLERVRRHQMLTGQGRNPCAASPWERGSKRQMLTGLPSRRATWHFARGVSRWQPMTLRVTSVVRDLTRCSTPLSVTCSRKRRNWWPLNSECKSWQLGNSQAKKVAKVAVESYRRITDLEPSREMISTTQRFRHVMQFSNIDPISGTCHV